MIITLKGANFASSNIGTLSTWTISRNLGTGATYSGATTVNKGAALNATVTIADGYELGSAGVTVTMGGATKSGAATVNGNTITIFIASVTGNVVVKVPTKSVVGEEQVDFTKIKYTNNSVNEASGAIGAAREDRLISHEFIRVQQGDSISIPEDIGCRFILYCYSAPTDSTFLKAYLDCDPDDTDAAVANWGYSYTFSETVASITGATLSYPLYVRIIARADDGGKNGNISPGDFWPYVTYNISADNSHLTLGQGNMYARLHYAPTAVDDASGALLNSSKTNRLATSDIIQVQEGDTISIPETAGYRFICYTYTSTTDDSYTKKLIDCNLEDSTSNAKNWGYSYTFPAAPISTNGSTLSYPLYVRCLFRADDDGANGDIVAADIWNNVTYNIAADNSHLTYL